ncbi:energy transducer TonB [Veillonella caviae]|uniref:energy transducer TonB n=1 Tax=Veillonella caviae TaxID=248316 RepID=UPI000F8CB181|nr:energy transducer TonB [Veillonella caviae]
MGLGISWKKAAIISAVVHLIILFITVIFFVVVPAIQEQETYEVDLTQSVLDDGGSGHAGGGGGDRSSLFPKPLSADEMSARTKAVVANVEPSTATDIPDAVDVPSKGSENKSDISAESGGSGNGAGSGGGEGGGYGTGIGTGVGDGEGEGEGSGTGKGSGNGYGRAHVAFDELGFYNAVNNHKVIPQQYIRQHREVHETIYVFVRIDTDGNAVEQYVSSGDDPLLREEAMAAVSRALPYSNPTGGVQPVTVPVRFDLSEGTDDDD